MSTQRVDFYLLNQSVPDGKLRCACRLSRKAHDQGLTTFIQTGDRDQAARLDDLLWTFDQGSFIPHRLAEDGDDPAPVVIGTEPPRDAPPAVLITLAGAAPDRLQGIPRIAEIVDASDAEKRSARERYRVYRDRGCDLDSHHIDP